MNMMNGKKKKQQRGSALLLVMIALVLLLAVAFVMVFSTITETRIDANFSQHKQSYYASRAGLEELRDRMRYPSTNPPGGGGLSDMLPKDVPGTAGSVLYLVNPAAAEVVNPADPANKYFDFELCHEYDPAAIPGQKCSTAPTTPGWELPVQNSIQATAKPMAYKWVRVNMKTNGAAAPFCADGVCNAATLNNRVCWNGQQEVTGPDAVTRCKDLNMHQVYMLTSYSSRFGARALTRYEVASDAIRPPGAINLESANAAPAFNNGSQGTGVSIPPTNIDGRPRDINGNLLPPGNGCAAVPSMSTDSTKATTDLQGALDDLRNKIVQRANDFCDANGNSTSPGKQCTRGLWWVRGTDPTPRFSQNNCNLVDPTCYKNLNLQDPALDAIDAVFGPHLPIVTQLGPNPSAPFIGAPGNVDPLINQVNQNILQQNIANINKVVSDSVGQSNYVSLPTTISGNQTFGSPTDPQIVVASGGLEVQNNATVNGFGILVVGNNFRIDQANFNWTGIVLVQPPSGEFRLDTGATGKINGALLLQADANGTTNVRTSDSNSTDFTISYSCEALDMAYRAAPLKIISYSEISY